VWTGRWTARARSCSTSIHRSDWREREGRVWCEDGRETRIPRMNRMGRSFCLLPCMASFRKRSQRSSAVWKEAVLIDGLIDGLTD
jgi:hypothetical protein